MKALPTQERALRKRTALIDAAIVEFSTAGFEVATAKSIAAKAGVATGTFYQYFDNKNDILRVIASERYQYLHRHINGLELPNISLSVMDLKEVLNDILHFVYDFHCAAPQLHQVLEQRRSLDSELSRIMDQGEGVLRGRVLAFVKTSNQANPDIVADNLFAMAEGIIHRLVFNDSGHDADRVIEIGAEMLASFFKHNTPLNHSNTL